MKEARQSESRNDQTRAYRDLIAWQKGIEFVAEIYALTADFPREELYGLKSQLRRAAVSVPSNIAEGQGRAAKADFIRFLRIAQGSLAEVDTQLEIAKRLGLLSAEATDNLTEKTIELRKILFGLINSLK